MAKYIWIDDAYNFSGDTLYYCVKKDGVKIYEGVAIAQDFPIRIFLNRIAQGYIESTFPQQSGVTQDKGAYGTFSLVQMNNGVEGATLYSQTYLDGYDGVFEGDYGTLSEPINGHADPRQRLLYTVYSGGTETGTTPDTGDTSYDGDVNTEGCNWVRFPGGYPFSFVPHAGASSPSQSNNGPIKIYAYTGVGPNYYVYFNGVTYWINGKRRLQQEGYGYPNIYKCVR